MADTVKFASGRADGARAPAGVPGSPPAIEWADDSWRSCVRCPVGRCNVRTCDDGSVVCVPVPGTARLRLHDPS